MNAYYVDRSGTVYTTRGEALGEWSDKEAQKAVEGIDPAKDVEPEGKEHSYLVISYADVFHGEALEFNASLEGDKAHDLKEVLTLFSRSLNAMGFSTVSVSATYSQGGVVNSNY